MRESNDGNVDRLESVASEGKKGECVNCGGGNAAKEFIEDIS